MKLWTAWYAYICLSIKFCSDLEYIPETEFLARSERHEEATLYIATVDLSHGP